MNNKQLKEWAESPYEVFGRDMAWDIAPAVLRLIKKTEGKGGQKMSDKKAVELAKEYLKDYRYNKNYNPDQYVLAQALLSTTAKLSEAEDKIKGWEEHWGPSGISYLKEQKRIRELQAENALLKSRCALLLKAVDMVAYNAYEKPHDQFYCKDTLEKIKELEKGGKKG